jgi:hypothetical protein
MQPRLIVGPSNDPLEQEADRIADQVMTAQSHSAVGSVHPQIQRFSAHSSAEGIFAPPSVERVVASPGRPLESSLRRDMEHRFGHDFSKVKVHSDTTAGQSAREVDADAYTVGPDIVFAQNRYEPDTTTGRHLLAHELTHVIQQTASEGSSANGVDGRDRRLSRYRSKGKDTIAFEGADETLTDPKKQPWIDSIDIVFTAGIVDTGHKADAKAAGQLEPRMPKGTLTAKYSSKSSTVLADIVLPIVGGSTMLGIGLTDRVKDVKVKRLEGLGYMDSENIRRGNLKDPVSTKGKGARYSASGAGSMNYAIFFKGIQAIHEGSLNIASHACVHVDAQSSIRTLNHHSRIGVTKVSVSYDSSVLTDLCCHRKNTGNTNWDANPCEKTKCP